MCLLGMASVDHELRTDECFVRVCLRCVGWIWFALMTSRGSGECWAGVFVDLCFWSRVDDEPRT